ncbi:MAG TPA: MATE family efflux transporter, partial [Polyangiaceae bacterium]|nr:MATE family efflux transporter [Polyangiaceae bacterium]
MTGGNMGSEPTLARRLLTLAWPVALSRLGIMGMGVCDAMVVGQLAPRELAHQALGWAPTSVLLVASIGMLTGVQVLAARTVGAGHPERAAGALQRGLVMSLLAGAVAVAFSRFVGAHVYAAFGVSGDLIAPSTRIMQVLMLSVPMHLCYVSGAFFVEAVERPLLSTYAMWAANLVNLVLNLWLVPRLGALGSAWATVGARFFLAATMLACIFKLPDAPRLGLHRRCAWPGYKQFLSVGAAAAISHAAESSAFSGMTIVAGRLGGSAVAAYQILLNLLAIVFMFALGLATATGVLASQATGRGAPREAARVSWHGLALNTGLLIAIASAIVLFALPIARAYTADLKVAMLVASIMPI